MSCADTVNWRKTAKIDECLETFLPDDKDNKLRRFLPSGFVGLDKTVSSTSGTCMCPTVHAATSVFLNSAHVVSWGKQVCINCCYMGK